MQGVGARFESDDGTIEQAPNAQLWMKNLIEACAKFGKPVDCADKWGARLKRAGFVDVHEEIRKVRAVFHDSRVLSRWLSLTLGHSCLSEPGPKIQSSRSLVNTKQSKS